MNKKTGLFVMAAILGIMIGTTSCATVPTWEKAIKSVPLPPDIKIVPPSFDVPQEIAAFSGKWTGLWEGYFNSILIVEEITSTEAKVLYANEADARWKVKAGYKRFTARVVPGAKPQIEFSPGEKEHLGERLFCFEMQKDLNTLKGDLSFLIKGYGPSQSLGIMKRAE